MLNALRPFLAALLTLPLRALAGWLTARGIEVTGTQVSGAVEAMLVWGLPLISVLGIVARRVADKWINPGNAASSHLATVEKQEVRAIKEGEKATKLDPLEIPPRHFRPPVD